MKKTLIYTTLCVAFLLNSCSNDFDVSAPWKDIPIVYGLINLGDDVHYIRVEKAFLDPDGDALEIAKIPDSLYYENLTVQLSVEGSNETFTLERVDGTEVDLPRDEGIFAHDPNWLYKVDASEINLEEGDVVNLSIDRENGLPLITATTIAQSEGRMRRPNPELPTAPKMDFSRRTPPPTISWGSSADARVFDVTLFLNYIEYPADMPNDTEEKTVEWSWVKGLRFSQPETTYSVERESAVFYEVLANNIPEDPNMVRFFKDIKVQVVSGGEALEKYVSVVQANSGITASQEPPSFTNLSEGLGIFSSINFLELEGVLLSNSTLDSLRSNALTAPLNFQ